MPIDYKTLNRLRQTNPAWRLLCAQHAPLAASFLHRTFIAPNVRNLSQGELVEALNDELFRINEEAGEKIFAAPAQSYLNDWAENEKGWLRKFYPAGTDEPHFDLTPSTEKALLWLEGLEEHSFVGTESRLLTLFDLLRQMSEGSQRDPQIRIADLQKRRQAIDAEIDRIKKGDMPLLDDSALKERFQQFTQMSRDLLADFRKVEENFRQLDRRLRERIALWESSKGELLEEILGERDTIEGSDQGRSFRAFWDFLMSQPHQEELSSLLERVMSLPQIKELEPEMRMRRIHYDWLEAGEHTQRTVAMLSGQMRRFLDEQVWLENRRIMDILHSIESHAFAVKEVQPAGSIMAIDAVSASIELPLERPLFRPPVKPVIDLQPEDKGDAEVDTEALYAQVIVDRSVLAGNIEMELVENSEISIAEVVKRHPLQNGLAELVSYLQVAGEWQQAEVIEEMEDEVEWQLAGGSRRRARLPRIVLSLR